MKILVAVKRVIDSSSRIRIAPGGKHLDLSGVKYSLNPFCETALEEAIRIKETRSLLQQPVVVTALSCAPLKLCKNALQTAVALGADRAVCVEIPGLDFESLDVPPLAIASAIHRMATDGCFDLILCGKQSVDTDYSQTATILASLLDWNQATAAKKLELTDNMSRISVWRDTENDGEILNMKLPAVVSCDLCLNKPRFVSLPKLIKARNEKIDVVKLDDIGKEIKKIVVQNLSEPVKHRRCRMVSSVDELISNIQTHSINK